MRRFDLKQVLASKSDARRRRANAPIAEKLRMLDALREREIALRSEQNRATAGSRSRSDRTSGGN